MSKIRLCWQWSLALSAAMLPLWLGAQDKDQPRPLPIYSATTAELAGYHSAAIQTLAHMSPVPAIPQEALQGTPPQ